MARFCPSRAFILGLGGMGVCCSILFCPRLQPRPRLTEQSCRLHLPFTGGEIQGTLAGGGRISNSSTNEPTAGELVTHLRDLLGSALATGSRNSYRRAWLIFAEFHGRFFGTTTPTFPLWSAICFKIMTRYTCGFFPRILAIIPATRYTCVFLSRILAFYSQVYDHFLTNAHIYAHKKAHIYALQTSMWYMGLQKVVV